MRRSWLRLIWTGVVVAGAVGGYLVSSGAGTRLLHQEIENQLGRLLEGPVEIAQVDLRLVDGLRLEAKGFEAYPSAEAGGVPALRARRVLAWIDLLALLIGRLELSTLILEGPHLHLERDREGRLAGLPLPPIRTSEPSEGKLSLGERLLRQLELLDPIATAFTRDFRSADRIEIQDGTVSWLDHLSPDAEGAPRSLRLELVEATAERDWLSQAVALEGQAVFVDGQHAPFPIHASVRRDEGQDFDWQMSFSQIPLAAARTPLDLLEHVDALSGRLDADFHLSRGEDGENRLHVEGRIDDASIELRRSQTIVEYERLELLAELRFDSRQLRVERGRAASSDLAIEIGGAVSRPIRPESRTEIDSHMIGVQFEDLRELADSLKGESETALALHRLTERVQSGRIQYIRAAGTAQLAEWEALLDGETRDPPDGFLLGGAFDQFVVGTGPDDLIEELAGEVEWVEDQISLRDTTALFRGTPLPTINVTFEGISNAVRFVDTVLPSTHPAPPTPGFGALARIIRPRDPNALPPVKAVALAIDHLDHPLLRFPFADLRVVVEPLRRGAQVTVREGIWGGAAVEGELAWFNDPRAPTVSATLILGPPPVPDAAAEAASEGAEAPETAGAPTDAAGPIETASASADTSTRPPERWGEGRFEIEFRPRARLPFRRATGFFRLDRDELIGNEVVVDLEPAGQAALRTVIELSDPDSIGLDLSFALTEGRLEGLSEFIRLPPDLATGEIGATGSMKGRVRPDTSFIAELDGRLRAEAAHGRIKTTLPLIFRLAEATEGYNPFAKEKELRYESMAGTIGLTHGVLSAIDFEIEGPLRVFAKAEIDTNQSPGNIRAVVGIFLFRKPTQVLEAMPLVRFFLPGSDKGLMGAYFEVEGPLGNADIDPLPLATMASAVPGAIKAPFKMLRFLFDRDGGDS